MQTAASERPGAVTAWLRGISEAASRSLRFPFGHAAQPVGVHFADDGIVYVGWVDPSGSFQYAREPYRDPANWEEPSTPAQRGAALQRAHAQLRGAPPVCAMAASIAQAPFSDVRLPPDMKPTELQDAALYQMKNKLRNEIDINARDYFAAMEPFARGHYNVGIVQKSFVKEAQDTASAAGLKLARLDHEARAWRRLLVQQRFDAAVITGVSDVVALVFNGARLHVHSFERPRATNNWAAQAEDWIGTLRADKVVDALNVAVLGNPAEENEYVSEFARRLRRTVSFVEVMDPLTKSRETTPPWLLAYGLALPERRGS